MSTVVVLPCLAVGRAEVAEARRALAGQGRTAADAEVVATLWTARALPAVIELLASTSLLHAELLPATFEAAPAPKTRSPLSVVAWRRDDEDVVEVVVLTDADLQLRIFENALVSLRISLLVRPTAVGIDVDSDLLDHSDTSPVVRLQRFSFGSAGKSPS
jgi:hypothetical protein